MAKYIYGFHHDLGPKYLSRNMDVFKKLMNVYIKDTVKTKIIAKLREVAQLMVDMVDGKFVPCPPYFGGGNDEYPVWTGAMHDATGVALYADGAMNLYIPTLKQIQEQYDKDSGDDNIWGNAYFQEAARLSHSEFSDDIWLVLFCAVPYAWKVANEGSPWGRGVNFFGMLSEDFAKMVIEGLVPLGEVTASGTFKNYP